MRLSLNCADNRLALWRLEDIAASRLSTNSLLRLVRRSGTLRHQEENPEWRPGVPGLGRIVAGGNEPPQPGRLAFGQVDPIRFSSQLRWRARRGDPSQAAIKAFLDPHEVLAKAWIAGLVETDAADRLRLGKGVADPGLVLDPGPPLRGDPKRLGIAVVGALGRAGSIPARDRQAACQFGRSDRQSRADEFAGQQFKHRGRRLLAGG